MDSNNAIEVRGLSKVYRLYQKNIDRLKEVLLPKRKYSRDHYALNDINFSVKKGETFGIIGTNGSGKSTLLKILTGVVTQTTGEVETDGKISALLELGAGFNPEYSGIENIYLNGTMMHYSKEEMDAKLNDIVSFADIGEFIHQPVKTYSSGMFARLAFAVAINVEPEILIVDEALSVGDAYFQNKCYRKFEQLKEKGTTILFVSHDMESVKRLCDRALWIEQGAQRALGNCVDVCKDYFNFIMKRKQGEDDAQDHIDHLEVRKDNEEIRLLASSLPYVSPTNEDIVSEEVKITQCAIVDMSGNPLISVMPKQKVQMIIRVEAQEAISNAIVGFTVNSIKGVKVFAGNTYLGTGKTISLDKKDSVMVVFTFEMPMIHSGQYLVSPAVAVGTQELHEMKVWYHSPCLFSVPSQKNEIAFLNTEYRSDVYILTE